MILTKLDFILDRNLTIAIFAFFVFARIANMNCYIVRRRYGPFKVETKSKIVIIRGELPKYETAIFVRRNSHLTIIKILNKWIEVGEVYKGYWWLTVTVSPLPTLIMASLSFRTLSLNSLMSFRVIIEAADMGGNST